MPFCQDGRLFHGTYLLTVPPRRPLAHLTLQHGAPRRSRSILFHMNQRTGFPLCRWEIEVIQVMRVHLRCSRLVWTEHGEGLVAGCSAIRSTVIQIAKASPPICRGLSVAKQQREGGRGATRRVPPQRANPDGLVGLDLGICAGRGLGILRMRDPRSDFKMHGVVESELTKLTMALITARHRAVVCSSKPLGCNIVLSRQVADRGSVD